MPRSWSRYLTANLPLHVPLRLLPRRLFAVLLPVLLLPMLPIPGSAAPREVMAGGMSQVGADSTALLRDARERQRQFERFRVERVPLSQYTGGGGCDERIGRVCIWFGGANELDFPPEPTETGMARRELIGDLYAALDEIRDPWMTGQLVHYLAEDGALREAEGAARRCDLEAGWWCDALLGYVLHLQRDFVAAEESFRAALAAMPTEEARHWQLPDYILDGDGRRLLDPVGTPERERQVEVYWRLSDPLFLVEGNDRLTEHFTRMVEARNQSEAENAYEMVWEADLEESLVRYGRNIGWSRSRVPPSGGLGGLTLTDSRRVTGHHDPASRGYLFPGAFLAAPAEVPPESWVTAPREARSWYAPPYAPDFRGLETQVARFRTDDGLLVVGAYRPAPPGRDPLAAIAPPREEVRSDPFAPRGGAAPPPPAVQAVASYGPVQAGLFLVPEAGGAAIEVRGDEPQGVLVLRAPAGRYVTSLEVLEPRAGRAWRARQGVIQGELTRGLVAVSDLMILAEAAPIPANLDEAIPLARPGIRVALEERFVVAWEVYGMQVEEEVQVTLGFTSGRPGFLQRVGQFLGVLQPEGAVEVTFSDRGPDEVETVFRAVQLTLPDMEPGEYTLHLRLDLPGREPAIASRPIIVAP